MGKSRGGPSLTIELCLFDLDGTLLRTTDLEAFRGAQNVNNDTPQYRQQLKAAARNVGDRHVYTEAQLEDLRDRHPNTFFGVFTRSPRAYAETLLALAYPNFEWDIIVAFEDVRHTKPHREGVWKAMDELGLKYLDKVALVGDELVDVSCAYRAGIFAFVDRTTWVPMTNPNWWTLERVPDAVFQGADELSDLIDEPMLRLPELEYLVAGKTIEGRQRRIDRINHFFPRGSGLPYQPIHVLGRLFSEYEDIKPRRNWHKLTTQVLDHKDAEAFPGEWVDAINRFVRHDVLHNLRPKEVVVTVVPFKPNRAPRLEALLAQAEEAFTPPKASMIFGQHTYEFVPDVLEFGPKAVSSHGNHLTSEQRFNNVRDSLSVKRPEDIDGKHVIVIDDVVTTGATLLWAHRYLTQAGAASVTCMSLTKAVGPS